jgi:hypothetical protein
LRKKSQELQEFRSCRIGEIPFFFFRIIVKD